MAKTKAKTTGTAVPATGPASAPGRSRRLNAFICAGLFLATFLLYSDVRRFDFVNLDDPEFVYQNAHVRAGLSPSTIVWAFTSGESANWIPLTRISHLLDFQVFGLNPGWHHVTNVLLHAIATILLFLFLLDGTGARWPSAFVAAVFALHPLHVESVAWISERKDVLYAVFWFAALWAYLRYVRAPGKWRYVVVVTLFALGLMAKPMMITLPFVLLLVDLWPLRRIKTAADWRSVVPEKVPLFGLAAISGAITYFAQQAGGAVKAVTQFPPALRLENAITTYLAYIGDTIWPLDLAAFYPYPESINVAAVLTSVVVLAVITWLVVRRIATNPYLATGWFWFLGTLAPVIGIIQVGDQSRADRYMYVPMAGLLIMIAWGAADLLAGRPAARTATLTAAVLVCVVLAGVARAQTQYWRDTEALYQRALAATDNNYMAHNALGGYLVDRPGRVRDAIAHFQAALRAKPDYAAAHRGLGLALARMGRSQEALEHLTTAVRLAPGLADARNNLGVVLMNSGRLPEAAEQFRQAVRLRPGFAEAHSNLAAALANMPGHVQEALAGYAEALRLNPDLAEAQFGMGALLANLPGREREAVEHLRAAVALTPDAEAHLQLANALLKIPGSEQQALDHLNTALRLNPRSAEAHFRMGQVLAALPGRSAEAAQHLQAALAINPGLEPARELLARLR